MQNEGKMKTVSHSKFGTGTVLSATKDTVTVDFNGTIKELVKMYANLKNEDGAAFEGILTNEERDFNSFITPKKDINEIRRDIRINTRSRWGI